MGIHFKAASLDDAMGDVLRRLLKRGTPILPAKGKAREFTSVLIELSDPRNRFSRTEGRGTLFHFLGETLWYLSGSDRLDFIEYYIPKYRGFIEASRRAKRARGAYGPRLFGGGDSSQMAKILAALKGRNTDTRRAVLQIFDRSDLKPHNRDIPCTTTLQFLPRQGKLHLAATMRSNDAYIGFPGDVFAFTFIQELAAKTLGLELGTYTHFVGSLHLYDKNVGAARQYLAEGFQTPVPMPEMPDGDPWGSVDWLLKTERALRLKRPTPSQSGIDSYWLDLGRLLRIKAFHERANVRGIVDEKRQMDSEVYDSFIRGRQAVVERRLEVLPDLLGIMTETQTKKTHEPS